MQLEPGHWLHCAALAWTLTWLTQQAPGAESIGNYVPVEPCSFRMRLSAACGYWWAPAVSACLASSPGWISLSEAVLAGLKSLLHSLRFWYRIHVQRQFFFQWKKYPIGHWIPFQSSLFSNAALSFDIHPSAEEFLYQHVQCFISRKPWTEKNLQLKLRPKQSFISLNFAFNWLTGFKSNYCRYSLS